MPEEVLKTGAESGGGSKMATLPGTPNFFVVGAPKCGTTALYSYLRAHPRVFMPNLKEPRYFSWDMPGPRPVRSEGEYLELFAAAPVGTLVGEASPSYLASKVAIAEIVKRNPDARIVAILRNPIDMAHALHAHRLFTLQEDVVDFERAWELQDERVKGRNLPRRCMDGRLLHYRMYCQFSAQMRRLIKEVSEQNRMVCLFEEFTKNPRESYLAILSFLGLQDDGRQYFARVNANRALRSRRLADANRLAEEYLGSWYRRMKVAARRWGHPLSRMVSQMNAPQRAREPLRAGFRRRLAEELAGDVGELERLLNRRLTCWKDFRGDRLAG